MKANVQRAGTLNVYRHLVGVLISGKPDNRPDIGPDAGPLICLGRRRGFLQCLSLQFQNGMSISFKLALQDFQNLPDVFAVIVRIFDGQAGAAHRRKPEVSGESSK